MNNRQLREAARKKVSAKGVTPVLFLAYAPSILLIVYSNLRTFGISFQVSWIFLYAIQFAILLFSYAGGARVSIRAWRKGEARVSDLVAYFADGRLFLRALVVVLLGIAASWGAARGLALLVRLVPWPIVILTAWPIVIAFLMSLNDLYYALEIGEGESLWRTILFGVGKIFRAFFRIVGMAIALWWWVVLIFVTIGLIAVQAWPHWAAALLIIGFLTLIYWFLGPYFRLAQAGLAIEIFRGAGEAADPPEEEPEVIQMGSWEEYQKRTEEAPGEKTE